MTKPICLTRLWVSVLLLLRLHWPESKQKRDFHGVSFILNSFLFLVRSSLKCISPPVLLCLFFWFRIKVSLLCQQELKSNFRLLVAGLIYSCYLYNSTFQMCNSSVSVPAKTLSGWQYLPATCSLSKRLGSAACWGAAPYRRYHFLTVFSPAKGSNLWLDAQFKNVSFPFIRPS